MFEKFVFLMALLMYKWLIGISTLFILSDKGAAHTALSSARHPFYVSVTEINHNPSDKTLEISCKIFMDDLEQILEKNYNASLDITSQKDEPQFNKFIPDYISKNLSLAVDGKAVKFQYIGYEVDREAAWCYFQVDHISSLKKLDVSNGILYDFIDSEINIMHVSVNGKRKSTKVAYPERNASFSF